VESDNTQKVNKNTIKNLAIASTLALVLLVGVGQLPVVLKNTNMAALPGADYLRKMFPSQDMVAKDLAVRIQKAVASAKEKRGSKMKANMRDATLIMCLEMGDPYIKKKLRTVTSGKGAKGPMQVMPRTFKDYKRRGVCGFNNSDSISRFYKDKTYQIEVGIRIWDCHLNNRRINGNRRLAARAYNGGLGAVTHMKRETRIYAGPVFNICKPLLDGNPPRKSGRYARKKVIWSNLIRYVVALEGGATYANAELQYSGGLQEQVGDWWNSDNGQELSGAQDGQNYEFNTNNENDVNYENTTNNSNNSNNSNSEYYKPKQKFVYYPPTYTYTPQVVPTNPQVSLQQEATLRQAGYTTTAPHQGAQPVGFIQVQQVNIPNSYAHTYAQPTILQRNSMYQATRQNAFIPFAPGGATEITI